MNDSSRRGDRRFQRSLATNLDDSLRHRGLKPTATIECRSAAEAQDNRHGLFRLRSWATRCVAAACRRILSPICRRSSGRCSRFNTNRASSAIAARTMSSLGGCTRRGVAKSCGSGSLRKTCRGQKLSEQIDRAIQVNDRLLLVLSEHSSNWKTHRPFESCSAICGRRCSRHLQKCLAESRTGFPG